MLSVRAIGLTVLAVTAVAGSAPPAAAHHGGAVEWSTEQRGPVTGTAKKFAFQFPHVYITFDVAADGDTPAEWTLVSRWTPTILRQHGWSRESIKAGDTVKATYLPHVDTPRIGLMQSIEVNGVPLELDFE